MKITIKNQEKYIVRFGDLSASVCFEYNDKIYMKISNASLKFHAVNLEYGYLEEFDEDTKVTIIEIEGEYRYLQKD